MFKTSSKAQAKPCGRKRVHGHARSKYETESRTYKAWAGMKQRCNNPRTSTYSRYGGRGITYAVEWSNFEAFLKDMGEAPVNMTLDRIDNNGNYCKENCRWATRKQQANNRKHPSTLYDITLHGVTKAVSKWCSDFGIKYHTALWRLHKGWSLDKVFTKGRN